MKLLSRVTCAFVALFTLVLEAANPSGPLRVSVIAAPNFVVDSNAGTPASQSPRAAYVGATFYNDGAVDATNVYAYIGSYIGGTNSTPGLYPRRSHSGLTGPFGGQFALVHEGGTAGLTDASRYVGTIPAHGAITVYWLVSYPILDETGKPVWGSGPNPSDDLYLYYDIWGIGHAAGAPYTVSQTTKATMRNEISAMANKIFPNTANQVPQQYKDLLAQYAPAWTNIAADGSPGTTISAEGIWYQLGNVGDGYDADGDLVFDHDAWLQPVGNPDLFDTGVFRLYKTHTLLVIQLKGGGEKVITVDDQLYFKDLPENNSVVGFVRYDMITLQAGGNAQLTPYQEAASGSNNEKFNGDYGAAIASGVSGTTTAALLAKNASPTNAVAGTTVGYTLSFTNNGTIALGDPNLGIPVVIQERMPTGMLFVAGSASTGSNQLPAGVPSYTLFYSTNNRAAWQTSEPVPATNVTDIQWWMNGVFAPGASGSVSFAAQVAPGYRGSPVLVNEAGLSIGNGAPFLTARAEVLVSGTNSVGDRVFADDGFGGGLFGNGLQDGGGGRPFQHHRPALP